MGHSHGHPTKINRTFKIAVGLNVGIVVFELVFGFLSHSISLIADAGHNFTDVLGLLLAWGANVLAQRPPTRNRTYGYRRTTILASLVNAIILLIATGGILWEAVSRFVHPVEIAAESVVTTAAIALVLNGITAALFAREHHHDINIRGAFLHMVSDAALSAGVVVAGLVVGWTGLLWVDPLMSIIISVVIAASTWGLLKESFNLASDAVPRGVDRSKIEHFLRTQPGVADVHDLHIWGMSTTDAVLTAHLVMPDKPDEDEFLFSLARTLHEDHGIAHTTIQIECGGAGDCHLAPEHVV